MSFAQNPSVALSDVSFNWSDGSQVFNSITAAFGRGAHWPDRR